MRGDVGGKRDLDCAVGGWSIAWIVGQVRSSESKEKGQSDDNRIEYSDFTAKK